MGDIVTFSGIRYCVVYAVVGDYSTSDGKGAVRGISFIRVEPA